MLERFRAEAFEVWNRVTEHNARHPVLERERSKVVFYFGQNVIKPSPNQE